MKDLSIMVLFLLNLHWWLVAGLVTFATRKDDFKSRFPWTMFTTFVFAFLFEKYVSKDVVLLVPMGVVCVFMAFVTNKVLDLIHKNRASKSSDTKKPESASSSMKHGNSDPELNTSSSTMPRNTDPNKRVCRTCHKAKLLTREFRVVSVAEERVFSRICRSCEKRAQDLRIKESRIKKDAAKKIAKRKKTKKKKSQNGERESENSNKASVDKSTISDTDSETLTKKLTELKGLLDSGLIDDQDYAEKKSELLKKF